MCPLLRFLRGHLHTFRRTSGVTEEKRRLWYNISIQYVIEKSDMVKYGSKIEIYIGKIKQAIQVICPKVGWHPVIYSSFESFGKLARKYSLLFGNNSSNENRMTVSLGLLTIVRGLKIFALLVPI